MDKIQKKALVTGLIFVVILNLFVIVWLISDLFAEKEDTNRTISSTEEITMEEPTTEEVTTEDPATEEPTAEEPTTEEPTTEEPTTEEPTTEEPTTEAVAIEPGNIHTDEQVKATDEIIQQVAPGTTVLADLDGDGTEEKITLLLESEKNSVDNVGVHFQVSDLYYNGKAFGRLCGYVLYLGEDDFFLIDLDTSDRWVEIGIRISDGSTAGTKTVFLRYQDNELICIGRVNGYPTVEPNPGELFYLQVPGDGTVSVFVYEEVLLHHHQICKTWRLSYDDTFHTILEEIIPEYYEFGLRPEHGKLCLLQDMTFFAERNGMMDDLVMLPAGTKVDIARYYPDGEWIQILYEQGTKAAWMRRSGGILLPVNLFESSTYDWLQQLAIAG